MSTKEEAMEEAKRWHDIVSKVSVRTPDLLVKEKLHVDSESKYYVKQHTNTVIMNIL